MISNFCKFTNLSVVSSCVHVALLSPWTSTLHPFHLLPFNTSTPLESFLKLPLYFLKLSNCFSVLWWPYWSSIVYSKNWIGIKHWENHSDQAPIPTPCKATRSSGYQSIYFNFNLILEHFPLKSDSSSKLDFKHVISSWSYLLIKHLWILTYMP